MPIDIDNIDLVLDEIQTAKNKRLPQAYTRKIDCPDIIRELESKGYSIDNTALTFTVIKW